MEFAVEAQKLLADLARRLGGVGAMLEINDLAAPRSAGRPILEGI